MFLQKCNAFQNVFTSSWCRDKIKSMPGYGPWCVVWVNLRPLICCWFSDVRQGCVFLVKILRLLLLWLKEYDLDNGVISMTVYPSRYFLNGRTNEGSLSALPDNKKLTILRSIIVSITEALTGVIYFIPLLSNWAFPLNPSICFLYSCLVDASETIFSRSQLTKIEHILKSGVRWIR